MKVINQIIQSPKTGVSLHANESNRRLLIGRSPVFKSLQESIKMVADRECSVIINGETGAGKEMVARQIHAQSERAERVFIPADCTTLQGALFESQLFGHVRGAFTGAVSEALGLIRSADGGTLFLDEIGELSPDLQAKLLRVLQESTVMPVGANRPSPVDVRVICATNRDLKQMVRMGTFRADLYFRLNVVRIEVPPLRERKGDLPLLIEHFLQLQSNLYEEPLKSFSPEALAILRQYDWPGNVRELANAVEHAYINSPGLQIGPQCLPEDVILGDLVLPGHEDEFASYQSLLKKLLVRALKKSNGRKLAAARLLKMDHRKLARLVDEFGLEPTWK